MSLLADSGWGAIVAGDGEDGNQGRPQGAGTGPKVALDLSRVFRTFPKSLDGLPTGCGLFLDSPLLSLAFLSFLKLLFIYFWLCWVFIAVPGFSLVVVIRGYSLGVWACH